MFFNVLKKMEEAPLLFGCENVENLHIYILGYENALWENKIEDNDFQHFRKNFTDFIKKNYRLKIHHPNWASIIRFYSTTNKESLDNFFILFNKFMDTK
jgi:hypothetical protein